MQALKQFSLPIKGLKIGTHSFSFEINQNFFTAFEHSPFKRGAIEAKASLEKKSDHMVMVIEYEGTIDMDCDRCTDLVKYPVKGTAETLIKYSEQEREEEEVIYIHHEASEFNCAKVYYDAIILGLPLNKTCDDVADKECNPEVIRHLDSSFEEESEVSETALSQALKGLNITKN